MRVRLYDEIYNPNTTPSGTSYYGQVENYSLNVGQLAVGDLAKVSLKYNPNYVKDILNISSDQKINSITVYNAAGRMVKLA